ncbi:MAG: DUF1839 family protein [Gemmatimonadaceae bacterium]
MNSEAFGLDASKYVAHDLHRSERIWPETNCYVDLWIELLHSLELDPMACMAFTLAMDFEGDQWTFFKPPPGDIYALYGVDVQELAIWRPLSIQLAEQVRLGRVPLVEVDAFHLPDTVGVSYGIEHTKTTVGVQAIDLDDRVLGYFHSSGYFVLRGGDFDAIFNYASTALAPYTEIAKLDRVARRGKADLTAIAREQVRHYVARVPRVNPVTRYRERYASDVQWLIGEDMQMFYKYAFATLRQCGACAEMAATFLAWLADDSAEPSRAAADFNNMAAAAKAMQFKIARMMATGKPVDVSPLLDKMEASWASAMADLESCYAA